MYRLRAYRVLLVAAVLSVAFPAAAASVAPGRAAGADSARDAGAPDFAPVHKGAAGQRPTRPVPTVARVGRQDRFR
jgi:hypothetical protein